MELLGGRGPTRRVRRRQCAGRVVCKKFVLKYHNDETHYFVCWILKTNYFKKLMMTSEKSMRNVYEKWGW